MNLPGGAERGTEQMHIEALAFLRDSERRREWRAFYDLLYTAPPIYLGHNDYLGHDEWLLAGRDDVISVMKNEHAEVTALYPVTLSPLLNELFLGLLSFERGAEHHRLRSLVRPLFSAAGMSCLQRHVSSMLDNLLYPAVFQPEGCDVLSTLGVRVPEAISCLLLDVAPADWDPIGHWSRVMYKQMGRYNQSEAEIRESETAYRDFSEYVGRRMNGEGAVLYGGVGEALVAAWRKHELNDRQLLSYFALFLLTGLDTLTYAIGNSLWFLGNAPKVFSTLRDSPERAAPAFDEAMRLWGPIRLCIRHLQQPVRLSAGVVPQGSLVFLLIHAANRDPRRLDQPDDLVWHRKKLDDLAFGVGPHGCLGSALGKMVGRTLYRSLAERCHSLQVNPEKDNPQVIASLPILGIESVRLFAEPGRRGNRR